MHRRDRAARGMTRRSPGAAEPRRLQPAFRSGRAAHLHGRGCCRSHAQARARAHASTGQGGSPGGCLRGSRARRAAAARSQFLFHDGWPSSLLLVSPSLRHPLFGRRVLQSAPWLAATRSGRPALSQSPGRVRAAVERARHAWQGPDWKPVGCNAHHTIRALVSALVMPVAYSRTSLQAYT